MRMEKNGNWSSVRCKAEKGASLAVIVYSQHKLSISNRLWAQNTSMAKLHDTKLLKMDSLC